MNKSAILILAIGLLITWLLASSIGILIKLNESGGSQGGSSLNIHVSLPQPAITLPPINLTIPQRVNETSNAELYVPLIPLPVIMPNVSINITKYLAVSTPKPSQALSGGSPGTLGSQEGLGGSSQQYVSNTVVPLKIPPLLMMIAIISAIAIIGISSLAIIRREIHKSDQPGSTANVRARISPPRINVGPKSGDEEFPKFSRNIELLPGGEAVKKISGWGGGNDIIDLGIPRDLPLIWRFNDPLPMIVRGGDAQVMVTRPGGIISNGSLIMPSRGGCYGISIRLGDREEDLFVRAGDYGGDDIVNFVRLNIGGGLTVRDSETIREVMKRLVNDGVINGDWESINAIIRLFERVRYGLRDVDRSDYEKFLRALGRVFRDARVIICEGAS
ncbi:DUF4129 domain-containing protein [Vulcanisaeta distributa]|uniref:DUF4129 domain-containing protein n=1 Tax=Vulcanisaeta distributa TaxID=164451 RepID=UPI0006D19F4F|nr:DUF4129 domain-containing protein [Vulcanisaeta distributa]